jgi:hypothetical protein
MIVLPVIGAITAAQVGIWAIGGAVGGVASWLVHKVLKLRAQANALEARIETLENK